LNAAVGYFYSEISAGASVLEQRGPWAIFILFWGGGAVVSCSITWRARGARAYNGGLGAEPPAGSRGREGVRGRSPPEAESFLALGRATDRANLYPLQYFQQSITLR